MASTNVTTPPRSGRFDLCSFLVAVDILLLKPSPSLDVGHRDVGTFRVDDESLPLRINDHVHAFHGYHAEQRLRAAGEHNGPDSRRAILEANFDGADDLGFN